jgi:predicted phosphodiesterase
MYGPGILPYMSALAAATPDATASLLTTPHDGRDVVLLTCNDLHLTDVPPAARLDNYVDEMFGLLGQIAQAAVKLSADAVCIAGDIFHHKDRPMGTALLGRVVDWCKQLQASGTAVLVVPGNHDLRYNNLATLPHQPLGLMLKAGVMQDVSVQPWVPARCPARVTVQGIAYPHAMEATHWTRIPPVGSRHVVLAHCFASPAGGQVYGEPEHAYAALYAACPADVYVFGHDHSDGGIHTIAGSDSGDPRRLQHSAYFLNLGALSRGTIGYDDITREMYVGIVRIGPSVQVQRLKLQAIPASDLFDLSGKAAQQAQTQRIDTFIADLEATLASLDSTAPLSTHLGALTMAADVRARMQRYIDSVEHG